VPPLDQCTGVRIVLKPLDDADAVNTDGGEDPTTVVELLGLDDPSDRPDRRAHVMTADLAAALDQHDSELAVRVETAPSELAIARLEDVQREEQAREQDTPEG